MRHAIELSTAAVWQRQATVGATTVSIRSMVRNFRIINDEIETIGSWVSTSTPSLLGDRGRSGEAFQQGFPSLLPY